MRRSNVDIPPLRVERRDRTSVQNLARLEKAADKREQRRRRNLGLVRAQPELGLRPRPAQVRVAPPRRVLGQAELTEPDFELLGEPA